MKGSGLDSSGSGQVAGSPEHGDATSECSKCQALNYMGNCAILKRQSYPCTESPWLEMGTFQNTRVSESEGHRLQSQGSPKHRRSVCLTANLLERTAYS